MPQSPCIFDTCRQLNERRREPMLDLLPFGPNVMEPLIQPILALGTPSP